MHAVQRTLAAPVTLSGIGLHSGVSVTLTLRPAPADAGIVFVRTDLSADNRIPARFDYVVDTRLCTVLGNAAGARVGTVEHLMAALRGADITNLTIEIDGAEVPAMDGSAAEFLAAIDQVGTVDQGVPVQVYRLVAEVTVQDGDKVVSLTPAPRASFTGMITYQNPAIGTQAYGVEMLNGNFRHEISAARTFGLESEVEAMRSAGLALGGSLANAIVVGDQGVLNPDGLRFQDEFIRHKLLDAIGDLMLAGRPIIAAYRGEKMSHAMNNALVRKMLATPEAWRVETL
jgi:UDP-3-O-[3-hydroxymyristoyl] N-acetylglucosamine deacetylase